MASKNISLDELKRIRPLKKGALNKERKATQKYINEFKLSEIRKNLEFTQIEVAEIIGIDQSNVSRIEKPHALPVKKAFWSPQFWKRRKRQWLQRQPFLFQHHN